MPKQFRCRTSYDTKLITAIERSPLAYLQRKTAFWLFAPVYRPILNGMKGWIPAV
jgi:hypothetical protein